MKLLCRIAMGYEKRKRRIEANGAFVFLQSGRWQAGGYALILVLLVTSLLIALTANFIMEAHTNVEYMRKFDSRLKAANIARSGLELAKMALTADKQGMGGMLTGKSIDKNIDCYEDIWALEFPRVPIGDGMLEFSITDESAKININAFANEFTEKTRYYYMAQLFFINLGLPMDFADIMHDWVDIDDSKLPYGAESGDYYMNLIPSYRAKNKSMDSIDECLMLKDITPEIFYGLGGGNFGLEENLVDHNKGILTFDTDKMLEAAEGQISQTTSEDDADRASIIAELPIGKEKSRALWDYFRVYGDSKNFLADSNKININTASYRVLSALTENMTDDRVTELIRRRLVKPFTSIEEIKDIVGDDEFETLNKYITLKSYIFKIRSVGFAGTASVPVTIYYNRDTKKTLYRSEE